MLGVQMVMQEEDFARISIELVLVRLEIQADLILPLDPFNMALVARSLHANST